MSSQKNSIYPVKNKYDIFPLMEGNIHSLLLLVVDGKPPLNTYLRIKMTIFLKMRLSFIISYRDFLENNQLQRMLLIMQACWL